MRANHLIAQFTSGELSPRLAGRPDIKKYASGARTILNGIVTPHGGVRKRPGSKFVARQKSATDDVRFVHFQFSTEQSYVLVFGPNYVWFAKDQGIITFADVTITGITQANPAVVTAAGHGFSNGDIVVIQSVSGMSEVNNRHFVVASAATNTFALTGCDSSSYTAYVSGGTASEVVELATDYDAAALPDLQFAQANDILYIVHPDYPLTRLNRYSHTSWTLDQPEISNGPFRNINPTRTNVFSVAQASYNVEDISRANPAVVTITGHPFGDGQRVEFAGLDGPFAALNGTTLVVANGTDDTFELEATDTSGYGSAYSGGGDEICFFGETGYGTLPVGARVVITSVANVFDADHVGGLFRLNEEGGATGVASAPVGDSTKAIGAGNAYTYEGNVYGVGVVSGISTWEKVTRVPDHKSGTVRVYASGGGYYDADYLHPGYSVVRITDYVSATEVTAEIVKYHMPQSVFEDGTSFWEEGAWSDYRGYPRAIAFFEQRLWLAGSAGEPTVLWGSRSAAWEDFEDGSEDDDAIVYRLASGSADVIRWLSGGRILTAGTSMGEYAIAASSQNEALTPTNFRANVQTTYGTSTAHPVRVNQAVLYPQRAGNAENDARKLREFAYSFQSDAYGSADITIFAEHVTGDGFDEITYALDPESLIFLRRIDGMLAACTYEREQEVVAWHRHALSGTDAEVKAQLVSPGDDGDELWLSVARTVGGVATRSIEVIALAINERTAKQDGIYMDAAVVYTGAATTTISGIGHLEGETVGVVNAGNVETAKTVTGGRITLDRSSGGGTVVIGLPAYTMVLEPQALEAGAKAGTAQARAQKISRAWLRVVESLGGSIGTTASDQRPIHYRVASDPMDSSPPLYTGILDLDLPSGWERDGTIRIEHAEPLPFFVAGLVAEVNTSG